MSPSRSGNGIRSRRQELLESLRGGLIVSCQAPEGSPLRHPSHMAAMAQAASMAGAVGIRANGPEDVRAIRQLVDLPIIGIDKRPDIDPVTYITPSLSSVASLLEAGADLVAIDATLRVRTGTGARSASQLISQIREEFGDVLIMADVATLAEGVAASDNGADIIATTLSGYTGESPSSDTPDFELIAALAEEQDKPVFAEGRFSTPEYVRSAFEVGAHCVVVGTAITDPLALAKKFVAAAVRTGSIDFAE